MGKVVDRGKAVGMLEHFPWAGPGGALPPSRVQGASTHLENTHPLTGLFLCPPPPVCPAPPSCGSVSSHPLAQQQWGAGQAAPAPAGPGPGPRPHEGHVCGLGNPGGRICRHSEESGRDAKDATCQRERHLPSSVSLSSRRNHAHALGEAGTWALAAQKESPSWERRLQAVSTVQTSLCTLLIMK